jgi:transketolase
MKQNFLLLKKNLERKINKMTDLSNIDMRDSFFEALYDVASQNPDVYFLSDDHGAFGLEKFQKDFPDRYINIGIAEQNMIGISSGLSLSGKIVYCYGISPFVSLKVLEQISLDLAAMGANVNIVSVGAGFTYATDGPSHHGLQDLSAILTTPNITILNSSDPISTKAFAKMGADKKGPKYIRIEKGILPSLYKDGHEDFSHGVSEIKKGNDLTIIASGAIVHEALQASKIIKDELGLNLGVIDLYKVKPLPEDALIELLKDTKKIVTLEEGYLDGGVGSMIASLLLEKSVFKPFLRLGIKNHFCFDYGTRDYLLDLYNLNGKKVSKTLKDWLKNI